MGIVYVTEPHQDVVNALKLIEGWLATADEDARRIIIDDNKTNRAQIAAQLTVLLKISAEDGVLPKIESLRRFLAFIDGHHGIPRPSIVVTCDGYIRAEWTPSQNRQFSAEFLCKDGVKFLVIAPDPVRTHNISLIRGTADVETAVNQARCCGVLPLPKRT